MILKFFNKNNEKTDINLESINIACLLIHAAKIDENYTSEEKEIIKKTVKKLYPDLDNLDEVVSKAEKNLVNNGEIKIKVEKARGKKCDRCWKILERRCSRENCPIK